MTSEHLDYQNRVESTEAERIAIAAAKLALNDGLNELFASFGINRANIKDMEEFRSDLRFVRSLRDGSYKAGSRFALGLITIFAGAFAWSVVQWFKMMLALGVKGHGGG